MVGSPYDHNWFAFKWVHFIRQPFQDILQGCGNSVVVFWGCDDDPIRTCDFVVKQAKLEAIVPFAFLIEERYFINFHHF